MTRLTSSAGAARGLRSGREEQSWSPTRPRVRNRRTHLAAVLGVTRKRRAAALRVWPESTNCASCSRLRRVSRAFLWMSIRSLLGNWIARHNQLLRFRSNGQPLERSQVAHIRRAPAAGAASVAAYPAAKRLLANVGMQVPPGPVVGDLRLLTLLFPHPRLFFSPI